MHLLVEKEIAENEEYTWQHNQLGTGSGGLEIKIQKEIAENEEGTMWSDRKARLVDCVAQKRNGNQEKKIDASMMIAPVLKADNIHVSP